MISPNSKTLQDSAGKDYTPEFRFMKDPNGYGWTIEFCDKTKTTGDKAWELYHIPADGHLMHLGRLGG